MYGTAMTLNMHQGLYFAKDTPFLALTGGQRDVFCEDLGEKLAELQRYDTENVYIFIFIYVYIYIHIYT